VAHVSGTAVWCNAVSSVSNPDWEKVFDPKYDLFWKSGMRVDCFRVMGRVAETALKQTLVTNIRSLMSGMLPTVDSMTLDHRGKRQVMVHFEDRLRVVHLSRHLRHKLHEIFV
jgi:hypothetical protein